MKNLAAFKNLLLAFCTIRLCVAWGSLGHMTVALVAENFVQEATTTYFQDVLRDNSSTYLARVATWADSYRYTAAGRFSAGFHYIDADDQPPQKCNVAFNRDCPNSGCVIRAIQNYTARLMNAELEDTERAMAAKFVIHFVGDIHQPLHDESVLRGGNGIPVLFESKETNLHSVWDSSIPEKLIGGYALADAQKWATTLTNAITSGIYKSQASTWLDNFDIEDPISTALSWAQQTNAYVCTTVFALDDPKAIVGKELGGAYYNAAIPVVSLQIARAGYRLAHWMDLIVEAEKFVIEEL